MGDYENAAAWNATAQIASTAATQIGQGRYRKKQAQFAKDQAQQARNWALDDWQLQNEYNHPSSQMARLREAGLNPNLIYGKGAGDMTTGAVRSTEPASMPQSPGPDWSGLAGGMNAYFNTKLQGAQVDNLRASNTLALQQAALAAANTQNVGVKTEADRENLRGIKDFAWEKMRLENLESETRIDLNRQGYTNAFDANERANAMQATNLQQAIENILTTRLNRAKTTEEINHIKQQIKNAQTDNELKKIELDWNRDGVKGTDAIYWRQIQKWLDGGAKWPQ